MAGRQAKILSSDDFHDLLVFASCTRNPLRNRVLVLLSAKAGLRAGEIANLTWGKVTDASGRINGPIELPDQVAKKCGGRSIPLHPDLAAALAEWRLIAPPLDHLVASERGGPMTPLSIVVWFNRAFRNIGLTGCSSHSGRRTFITRAARLVQGRWFVARRAVLSWPPVDPNDATVHRWRYRRAAQAGVAHLMVADAFGIEKPEFAPILPIETGRQKAQCSSTRVIVKFSRMSSRVRPADSPTKTREISS